LEGALVTSISACYFFTVTILLSNYKPTFPNSGHENERDIKIKPLHIFL